MAIESYRHSEFEVYVEVKGVFARQRVMRDSLSQIADNFRMTRDFISESIFPFLNQYDTPEEDQA
ncbi:MAG: hypothetical protein ACOX5J_14800 [Candidatus Hydrogenedentales bacterium]